MPHTPLSARARRAGGQPISDLMHRALAHPHLISLAAGFVDQHSLPVAAVASAFGQLWSDPAHARAALQYGTTAGLLRFREKLAEWLAADDSAAGAPSTPVAASRVVVTAGSNELLHLVTDTICDPGDLILCAAPTYFVYLGLLHNLGIEPVAIDTDEGGMVLESLDRKLTELDRQGALHRVRAVYLVSHYDNPSGVSLAGDRRRLLVELVRKWSRKERIYILEDAAYRQLRYEGDDLPSMLAYDTAGDTVVLAQTFSKLFSPGLRVGYGMLPHDLVEPVLHQKGNIDFGTSNFSQSLVAQALEAGLIPPHIATLRAAYRVKRDAMLAACQAHLGHLPGVSWAHPHGGLYVWLRLPDGCNAGVGGTLFDQALAEGMLYVPGEYCFPLPAGMAPRNFIRLSFGVQSPDRIAEGIAALARALEIALR